MNPAQAQAALGTVGTVAALGLFLPGIERAWQSDPTDYDTVARCRTGEAVYLGTAAAITLLACYAQGSSAPFVIGFGLALLIVGMQEHALRHRPLAGSDAGSD